MAQPELGVLFGGIQGVRAALKIPEGEMLAEMKTYFHPAPVGHN
jgi:hypothetical protein